MTLLPADRATLLRLGRESIRALFEKQPLDLDPSQFAPALVTAAGAFVTLEIHDVLRGCIGSILPLAPLYRTVAENAVNAAFRDPRFPPLTREEFESVRLEISIMSPIERVYDLESITVGRDGLIVRLGRAAGLLLPQVATDYGWDRQSFLRHTCQKAGLAPDAWKNEGCVVERFSAEVFGELDTASTQ